uniref:Uncharacterized protein n=1 Tax=Plectus sambesii TaxID=2011161 RepID=A0A914W364_9BILA
MFVNRQLTVALLIFLQVSYSYCQTTAAPQAANTNTAANTAGPVTGTAAANTNTPPNSAPTTPTSNTSPTTSGVAGQNLLVPTWAITIVVAYTVVKSWRMQN